MSDMKPVFKWEGVSEFAEGKVTLWPGTHRQMELDLPNFRTAYELGLAINSVTKAAFLQGRESMRGDMLNVPIYKDKP
jgi:hypothetical protein